MGKRVNETPKTLSIFSFVTPGPKDSITHLSEVLLQSRMRQRNAQFQHRYIKNISIRVNLRLPC